MHFTQLVCVYFYTISILLDEPEEDVKELILFRNRQLTIVKYYFINI
jgi:hypothetical protein